MSCSTAFHQSVAACEIADARIEASMGLQNRLVTS
jgi:hypothetical protein